eukprot:GHVU01208765.1.p1 GENE.GHVU01208765.1~~GHVU01208765.1.p1  ORF type:complete len:267 (-),score=78.07 GHVU01208765.1:99-899(-)
MAPLRGSPSAACLGGIARESASWCSKFEAAEQRVRNLEMLLCDQRKHMLLAQQRPAGAGVGVTGAAAAAAVVVPSTAAPTTSTNSASGGRGASAVPAGSSAAAAEEMSLHHEGVPAGQRRGSSFGNGSQSQSQQQQQQGLPVGVQQQQQQCQQRRRQTEHRGAGEVLPSSPVDPSHSSSTQPPSPSRQPGVDAGQQSCDPETGSSRGGGDAAAAAAAAHRHQQQQQQQPAAIDIANNDNDSGGNGNVSGRLSSQPPLEDPGGRGEG